MGLVQVLVVGVVERLVESLVAEDLAAAVQRLSAAIAGAVAYVEVVAACIFALILLGETLRTNQIIGGVIVLVGAFVAQSSVGKVASPEIPDADPGSDTSRTDVLDPVI